MLYFDLVPRNLFLRLYFTNSPSCLKGLVTFPNPVSYTPHPVRPDTDTVSNQEKTDILDSSQCRKELTCEGIEEMIELLMLSFEGNDPYNS